MAHGDKTLVWLRGEIKSPPLSLAARLETGYLLRLLQSGHHISLPHSRPMPNIGTNCHELRITDETTIWRIIYKIDVDAILILDVFSKKTAKTPINIVRNCKRRLQKYENESE